MSERDPMDVYKIRGLRDLISEYGLPKEYVDDEGHDLLIEALSLLEETIEGPHLLTLHELRVANAQRQAEWCPDNTPDLSFRGNELAGEVGEACNVIKKLERERQGWVGSRSTPEALAQELADIIICVDLVAMQLGIDLGAAVRAKFNATSEARGLVTRIAE